MNGILSILHNNMSYNLFYFYFFTGLAGGEEINSSLIAVFDGHSGAEASELSSRLLVESFLLHLHFLTDPMHSLSFKSQSGRLLN